MITLGIESSCDETSVAIIKDSELLVNLISSQEFHKEYGGVVPELSSRAHLQTINPLFKEALQKANITKQDIDLIAATAGPGLIGALLVGLTYGKSMAYALNKPFVPVNHIEGHMYSPFLMPQKPEYPLLGVVVSGGHTLLLLIKSETEVFKLGSTIDDAAGEAFDKVAKMIGLGYPGGPKIQLLSEKGDKEKYEFPVANTKGKFDFSFSGLKTAVLRLVESEFGSSENIPEEALPDITASFQYAVVRALRKNIRKILREYDVKSITLAGGVAANSAIRDEIKDLGRRYKKSVIIPDLQFCGDNAAMIALRGEMLYRNGIRGNLNSVAYPSLPVGTFK